MSNIEIIEEIEFEPSIKLAVLLGIMYDPEEHIYIDVLIGFTVRMETVKICGYLNDEVEVELNYAWAKGHKDVSQFLTDNEHERIQEKAYDLFVDYKGGR